jgi:phospholipid/cholesterol/gamma-HCH transport system substrate-binding protein
MRRRTVVLQLLVFGAISVLIVGYTLFSLLGVTVTNKPFYVTMHLDTGGGIFDGAEVAYRGVSVGSVSSTHLGTDGVTLRLKIDRGTRIPVSSTAHIYDLSPVGEQYVDLVPDDPPSTGSDPSYLHAGSVIPVERTTTPLQISTVLYDTEQFIDSLDPGDLGILGREGAKAFGGTGPQLTSILDNTSSILGQLSDTQDATERILANSALLLQGARSHASDFDTFASSLRALSGTLAASTPTIEKFLDQAAPTTQLIDTLVRENGSAIGVLLGNLATLSQIQVARIPALKALLVAVPEFGQRAAQLANGDAMTGVLNFNLDQALCPSGVPLTNPISGDRTPLKSVGCIGLPRGAANAPRPAGSTTTESGSATQLTSGSAARVAGYDPSTGLVAGGQVRLGTDGGQYQVAGDRSWATLLTAVAGG